MSLVALTAPSAQLGGLSGAPYVLGTGTALSGNTGFTCPWVPGLMLVVVSGATAAGVCTLNAPSASFTGPSITVAITTGFGIFGPIPVEYMVTATGLVSVTVATVTTATAFAALAPLPTNASHNPFELSPVATDF
jgi:hypothetical protein